MTIPFCKDCVHFHETHEDTLYPRCVRKKAPIIEPVRGTDTRGPSNCDDERDSWFGCGGRGRYFVAKEKVE